MHMLVRLFIYQEWWNNKFAYLHFLIILLI